MTSTLLQLEESAVQKWGSMEELEEEKNKRVEKKEKKALEKAKAADKGETCLRGQVNRRFATV